jgi:hypothetical protein
MIDFDMKYYIEERDLEIILSVNYSFMAFFTLKYVR